MSARQLPLPLTRRGRPIAKLPPPKEHLIHIAVVANLRTRGNPVWRFIHPASGELRDKRTAEKLKAMGVERGWPDLLLFPPSGLIHCLELKRKGGRLNQDQEAFAQHAQNCGWPYHWVDDLDQALRILEEWGALRKDMNRGNAA